MRPILEALLEDPKNFLEARYNDGFEVAGVELESFYLAAAQKKFDQLATKIPALQRLAAEQGIDSISSLDDLVKLLFPHTVYKSYPLSYLEKNRFEKIPARTGKTRIRC